MKAKRFLHALRLAIMAMMMVVLGVVATACRDKEEKSGPEVGVYCCYDNGDDNTALALTEGRKFVLTMNGTQQSGTYSLTDLTLTLTFSNDSTITAAYETTVITMTIENVSLKFYKTISYSVAYDSKGGSAVDAATVLNGKTLEKPTNPTRSGYEFIGWYTDSAFKTPFLFGTQKIVGDTTLYARWVVSDPEAAEYTVDFDLGYAAQAPQAVSTIDGKLYNATVPTPTRSGYTFGGWAISMYDDASKLSYMFVDGMEVSEDITLHAVWNVVGGSKLATPVVNVFPNAISWNAIDGVSTYKVEVSGPDGFEAISTTTGSTTYNVPFGDSPIGDYTVKVTAVASDSSKNSETAVRYYVNNALSRVSHFSVNGTVVSWNTVENATNYLLTIVCGDSNHNHVNKDMGAATSYDFATCVMPTEGIKFAVTTAAEGYVPMTSRTFTYEKGLGQLTGLAIDEATETLSWNAVENADGYVVSIKCGNAANNHEAAVVKGTSYSLKECENITDGIKINVYAFADGYGATPVENIIYNKTVLAAPSVVKIDGATMTWRTVSGATGYTVKIGDKTFTTTTNSIELSAQQISWVAAADYKISIQAKGANNATSLWSDEIDVRYYAMYTSIAYEAGEVSWNHVIGATSYEVRVNEGTPVVVEDGANFAKVALTKSGDNKIEVRYYDGTNYSSWVATTVKAYKVEFDTMVIGTEFATQYKAVGDPVDSFDGSSLKKSGYTFYGWYKTNAVGAGNAELYTDRYFRGTADVKLYADYTPNTYTVTYEYGVGGSGTETSVKVTYSKDFEMTIPTTTDPTKAFGGWYSAPGGTGIRFTDEYGVSVNPWSIAVEDLTAGNTEGTVAYAFWKDMVLDYQLTKVGGVTAYKVSKGARINLVTEVTIPVTYMGIPVKEIAPHAFKDCTKLKKINIPNTIEDISVEPNSSFTGCTYLEEINITEVAGNKIIRYWSKDGVLFDNGRLDEMPCTEVAAFPMAYKEKDYVMPEGVEVIPYRVFYGAVIETITIPASVETIENDAFYSAKIVQVDFAEATDANASLTIEKSAFRSCSSLKVVNLPAHLTSLATTRYYVTGETTTEPVYDNITTSNYEFVEDSFMDCSYLEEINVASGNALYSSVGGVLFNKNQTVALYAPRRIDLTATNGKYTMPVSVNKVAPGAFIYSYNITELVLPASVTEIGEWAFYNSYYIKKITFQGGGFNDVSIGDYAFRSCSDIEEIVFEKGSKVTTIGEGAFMYNYDIKSLTLPASIEEIGDIAFYGWYYLTELSFEETTKDGASLSFGDYVFYNSRISKIWLPAQVTELGGLLNGLSYLNKVEVSDNNDTYFADTEGILFNKTMTEILYYPAGKKDAYTLPASVTKIGAGVFRNNRNITSFTIGKNVTEIADGAFRGCLLLKTITFEAGGTQPLVIGPNVFRDCKLLTTIELPSRTESYGQYAFSYMTKLTTLKLNEGLTELADYGICYNASLETVTVPSTVEKIGYYSIANNAKLKTVTFAKNSSGGTTLKTIGYYALAYNPKITSITIPATVTDIYNYAFYTNYSSATQRSQLREVKFEENSQLETIWPNAFYYTGKLESITIPKNVTNIYYYAFAYSGLKELKFEDGGTKNLVIGGSCTYYSSPTSKSPSYAYGSAFYNCYDLETVIFPARLRELGQYSFNNANSLKTLKFAPDGQTSNLNQIGYYCFRYCYALEEVVLPKSLANLAPLDDHPVYGGQNNTSYMYNRKAVDAYAFGYCTSLKTVTFEAGGTQPISLANGAFYYCESLEVINLPGRLTEYHDLDGKDVPPFGTAYAFRTSSSTPYHAFDFCTNLKEINIAADEIAENMYQSIDGIVYSKDGKTLLYCPQGREKAVVIPKEVERIGDGLYNEAFAGCAKLTSVTFEDGGTAPLMIDLYAFQDCEALEEIKLPKRVNVINPNAFRNCTSLKSVELSADLTSFDSTVFFGCDSLASINIPKDNNFYVSEGGVVYNSDKTILYYYPAFKSDETFTVPSSVLTIYNYAFYGNTTLKKVVLPATLQSINEQAFYECDALEEVNIPKSVISIEDFAFYGCGNLKKVTFEEGGTAPLKIGTEGWMYQSTVSSTTGLSTSSSAKRYGFVFAYCSALENVVLPARTTMIADASFAYCSSLVSINIPKNIAEIGTAAFLECHSLETVEIEEGSKITAIAPYLFFNCLSLKEFTIPATIDEFLLASSNSYAFYQCKSLKTVTFEEGFDMTELPRALFTSSGLETITLPESVTVIKNGSSGSGTSINGVFAGCTNLKEIIFLGEIKEIGSYAFAGCRSLEEFEIPATVTTLGSWVFSNCSKLTSMYISDNIDVEGCGGLFNGCTSLTEVRLPDTMTVLPYNMFSNCKSLTEFTISENITVIEDYVFDGSGLIHAVVPGTVEELYYGVFCNCDSLETIVIEDGVQFIEEEFCYDCESLVSVTIPDSVTYLPGGLFYNCTALTTVRLPSNSDVTSIGYYMFQDCTSLDNVVIPDGYTTIEDTAFTGCTSLKNITIPDTVTEIYPYAFQNCTALESIVLPANLSSLGESAFEGCTSLKSVTFPSGGQLLEILSDTFANCTSLEEIEIPEGTTSIGARAFQNCPLKEFYLPSAVQVLGIDENSSSIMMNPFVGCTQLTKFEIDKNNPYFVIEDNVMMDAAKTEIYMVLPAKTGTFTVGEDTTVYPGAFVSPNLTEVVLPTNMKEIGDYAFYGLQIDTIVIPDGVETIGQYAFACSGLETINIPASVTLMGNHVFEDSKQLTKVTFTEGDKQLLIPQYAFRNCTSLEEIEIPYRVRSSVDTGNYAIGSYAFLGCSSLVDLTFEEDPATGSVAGTLNIGGYAFEDCTSLETVNFPKALGNNLYSTSSYAVGSSAFKGCTSLTTVTFQEVEEQWISFYNEAFADCTSLVNFVIPETTIYFGGRVFANTAIKEATIPETVTDFYYFYEYREDDFGVSRSINPSRLFDGCTQLRKVTINANLDDSTQYTGYMFAGCTALEEVIIASESFTVIGEHMFENCTSLKNLTIPSWITSVGVGAFAGLTSSQTVTIDGPESMAKQWDGNWAYLSDANFVFAK